MLYVLILPNKVRFLKLKNKIERRKYIITHQQSSTMMTTTTRIMIRNNRRKLLSSISSLCYRHFSIVPETTMIEHHHRSSNDNNKSIQSLIPKDGLTFNDFIRNDAANKNSNMSSQSQQIQTQQQDNKNNNSMIKYHLKTYGCQMNVNDSDIIRRILHDTGYMMEVFDENHANIILTNTCAIRDNAERKIWHRLQDIRSKYNTNYSNNHRKYNNTNKKKIVVGVLGCMAERLQTDLLKDGLSDIVVGPDSYRDLPRLIQNAIQQNDEEKKIDVVHDDVDDDPYRHNVNVQLSLDETYSDIQPKRYNKDDVTAFVSIQRGCSNRCSFCIVPYTRGGIERSRPYDSILDEIKRLHYDDGVNEVTLLGQNVNSYHDRSPNALLNRPINYSYQMSNDGFRSRINRKDNGTGYYFADLLDDVSQISPNNLRVRFTSPHPKDYPTELLSLMSERVNICNHLHMPAQSGSTSMLFRMKRGYSREAYIELIDNVRTIIPDVAISSDFITGFCEETDDEHTDTISLMNYVKYDQAYMFAYSMREKTHAHRTMVDNVPEIIKQSRLREMIDTFHTHIHEQNVLKELGTLRLVLIEGISKRSTDAIPMWHGRTDQNKRVVFTMNQHHNKNSTSSSNELLHCWNDTDIVPIIHSLRDNNNDNNNEDIIQHHHRNVHSLPLVSCKVGDYVVVDIQQIKGHTLRGQVLWRTNMIEFDTLKFTSNTTMMESNMKKVLNQLRMILQ